MKHDKEHKEGIAKYPGLRELQNESRTGNRARQNGGRDLMII